jgi:hypothetical protein
MDKEIVNHWVVHPLVEGKPVSLRALKPKGSPLSLFPKNRTFHPMDYSSPDELKDNFERAALSLNADGYNVYVVMNQIRDDFRGSGAIKDSDITHRTTILVDIDRIGDTSCPASQSEIEASFELSHRIESYLRGQNLSRPLRVHSGNGCHLYYRIPAMAQSPFVTATFERFLKGLATRFNNTLVGVDTSVFNASRITKVVGTVARKGVESVDRPYRMARIV